MRDREPTDSKVIQWGNSCAIKLPKSIRDIVGLVRGDNLRIYVTEENDIVVKKVGKES